MRVNREEDRRLFTSKRDLIADERMLDEWKRHYLLIDCSVQELNLSFGFVQIVLVSSTFVRFINGMFKVILNFNNKEDFDEETGGYMELHLFLILEFISLSLVAYVSQRIEQEVVYTIELLFKNNKPKLFQNFE